MILLIRTSLNISTSRTSLSIHSMNMSEEKIQIQLSLTTRSERKMKSRCLAPSMPACQTIPKVTLAST